MVALAKVAVCNGRKGITMAHASVWAGKVLALVKSGNSAAAIAQIKVAPSVRDLQALHKAIGDAGLAGRWRDAPEQPGGHLRHPAI